jgi:aryl-alcohol dehydrogenase-like predicted oxidoreductase
MGVVTMRSLTSGTFQKVMRAAFPTLEGEDLDAFLLNYNLSNPFLDVVLVGTRRREEVEKNNAISEDTEARLDLRTLHVRYVNPETASE